MFLAMDYIEGRALGVYNLDCFLHTSQAKRLAEITNALHAHGVCHNDLAVRAAEIIAKILTHAKPLLHLFQQHLVYALSGPIR